MPITPSEIAENLKGYLEETGGTDGPPVGSHLTKIMHKDGVHPVARMSKDGERPEIFFLAQITEGQYERRTIPVTLRWFVSSEKSEYAGGGEKTEEEIASGTGFVRKMTREFFQGIWSKDLSGSPVSLPSGSDSPEVVMEVFKDIAGVLADLEVRCEVSYRDGSDFPNFKWVEMTGSGFSL